MAKDGKGWQRMAKDGKGWQRKDNGTLFTMEIHYQIMSGLQGYMKENGRPELNISGNPAFKLFRDSLSAEIHQINFCWC